MKLYNAESSIVSTFSAKDWFSNFIASGEDGLEEATGEEEGK